MCDLVNVLWPSLYIWIDGSLVCTKYWLSDISFHWVLRVVDNFKWDIYSCFRQFNWVFNLLECTEHIWVSQDTTPLLSYSWIRSGKVKGLTVTPWGHCFEDLDGGCVEHGSNDFKRRDGDQCEGKSDNLGWFWCCGKKKKKVFERVVIIICLTGILKHIYITQHNLSLSNEIIK